MPGYDISFSDKEKIGPRYLCVECSLLLKEAVLTRCGHFYCNSCIENLFRDPATVPVCKVDNEVIDEHGIIPDNNTRQEVLSFTVRCTYCNEGCPWKGLVRHLEFHANDCPFHRVPCENGQCNILVKRADMQRHLRQQCLYRLQDCPFCNRSLPHNRMKTHIQEEHMDPQICVMPPPDNSQPEQNIVPRGQGNVQNDELRNLPIRLQVLQLQNQVNALENRQVELLRSGDEQKIEGGLLFYDIQKNTWKLVNQEERLQSIEHTLALRHAALADLEENLRQQEFSSCDGQLLWKISDFARRRNDAVTGQQRSFYSPCFWTGRYGYKMCARLYVNGDGMGRGTHISVFFVVMRGQYDALLRWPFRQKVTFMLLDQDNVEHVINAFRPDPSSSSFQRPRREMNIASGCPTFCALSELNNHAYVRDDTMFIKIIVDISDL